MAISPLVPRADLVSVTVTLDGQPIKDTYQIVRIVVDRAVNKIPMARLTLVDGSPAEENFPLSESGDFVPGKEVEIKAGYQQSEATIFKGVIVKHGLRVRHQQTPLLVVTCNDKAVKMTIGRNNAYFVKQKDSDVIGKLIGAAGLSKEVDATTVEHEELIQYYATDWDFIVTRAEINGMLVLVEDGKVRVKKPEVSAAPELIVTYGDDLSNIEAEIDARTQLPAVSGNAWDFSTQSLTTAQSQEPSVNQQGNLTGKKLAEVVGPSVFDLKTTPPIPQAQLKNWANAQLLKSRLARIQGTVSFQGNATPMPGKTLELDGLGARFNGDAFITAVSHDIGDGEWMTEVAFGLSPRWYTEDRPDIEAPLAAGLLPGVAGLQVGTVKKMYEDPDGEVRVQVDLPLIAPSGDGVWARLATFYATNNAGAFFMPEVGDEVILGFLNDDPRFPIILGSVYSKSKHKASYTPDEPNTDKAFVTKNQLKIHFEDVKKILTISTPGGHSVTLSDEDQTITIKDSNNNKIEMAPGGVTVESASNITIKAQGNLDMESTGPMTIKTQGGLSLEGLTVDIKAQTALTAQGNASATFKASGNVTVQGAMVMIN